MNAESMPLASCFCGAVQLQFGAALRPPIHCHCHLCRRLSGAAFTTWLSVPREGTLIRGEQHLSGFEPTPNLLRRFCKRCGAHMLTSDRRYPSILGVPAGAVPDDDVPPSQGDYFVDDRASWLHFVPAGACFGGANGVDPVELSPAKPSTPL